MAESTTAVDRSAAQSRPVLGVLGGMGPAATVDFLSKLVKLTPSRRDQDHISTLVCSFPQIPDRTEAILNQGPSPLPAMLNALEILESCGVSRVAIPCSTAHYWFDELQRQISSPIVHMIDTVAEALRNAGTSGGTIGLLATMATIKTGIYTERLRRRGFECLVPSDDDQHKVMNIIRAVKSGRFNRAENAVSLRQVAAVLFERGAQYVVLGCTELPLLAPEDEGGRFLDATEALARACIRDVKAIPPLSMPIHLDR